MGAMRSLLRRLFIAAVFLAALALLLVVADFEWAQHRSETHTSTQGVSLPGVVPAHPTLFLHIEPTEPPALGADLVKPLTRQLEARGLHVRWLEAAPERMQRPSVTLTLHAAPLRWTPFHADARVTTRIALSLPGPPSVRQPPLRGEVRVQDVSTGLLSRPAYLRYLAEASAGAIADTLSQLTETSRTTR